MTSVMTYCASICSSHCLALEASRNAKARSFACSMLKLWEPFETPSVRFKCLIWHLLWETLWSDWIIRMDKRPRKNRLGEFWHASCLKIKRLLMETTTLLFLLKGQDLSLKFWNSFLQVLFSSTLRTKQMMIWRCTFPFYRSIFNMFVTLQICKLLFPA